MVYHQPVLLEEIKNFFNPHAGDLFIDATLGNGGHSLALLQAGAKVIGLDADTNNLAISQNRINTLGFSKNFTTIHTNFSQLSEVLTDIHQPIKGILFDLGLSRNQLLESQSGFSFNDSQSLDMRLDPINQTLTADYIINHYNQTQITSIFSKFAQEKLSQSIAQSIIIHRKTNPITSASQLASIIKSVYDTHHQLSKINPATKSFLALRIEVNAEYTSLLSALNATLSLSSTIIALITFHSGEDRLVKQFIRKNKFKLINLTPKPIKPKLAEIKSNPLSRSGLLRVYRLK